MADRPRLLGALLVTDGGLDPNVLTDALTNHRRPGERLGQTLIRLRVVSEEQVARALATQFGLGFSSGNLNPPRNVWETVSLTLCRRHGMVPVAVSERQLTVAMHDPLDHIAIDDLRFQTGCRIKAVISTQSSIEAYLASIDNAPLIDYSPEAAIAPRGRDPVNSGNAASLSTTGAELADLVAALPKHLRTARTHDESIDDVERNARRAPVVRLVDGIVGRAIRERASDIHIEDTGSRVRVRMRIDGLLRPTIDLPAGTRRAVLSRLKVMGGMDISVRRRAQDGRVALMYGDRPLTLRVNTLPTSGGEKAVVRLLDEAAAPADLDRLGMSDPDLWRLRGLLERGEGVVLAAGPTGSGKSTTLFSALSEIDREQKNVITVEDPVEYRLDGASQVHVDRRAGLDFAAALRAILRQDPDVVMVGEIRDRETAEIAMSAAVTGHLVLSTIHATDAPAAITRLLHMGVPPFLVAGGLCGVVAQRLVRRSCPGCREGECGHCEGGLSGRTGLYQVLTVTDPMRDEISSGGSSARLRQLARDAGMKTLAFDARRAVAEGLTTPHEITRILRSFSAAGQPCAACGHLVPYGAHGCPGCGRPVARFCTCGCTIEPGWRYCAMCVRPVARA